MSWLRTLEIQERRGNFVKKETCCLFRLMAMSSWSSRAQHKRVHFLSRASCPPGSQTKWAKRQLRPSRAQLKKGLNAHWRKPALTNQKKNPTIRKQADSETYSMENSSRRSEKMNVLTKFNSISGWRAIYQRSWDGTANWTDCTPRIWEPKPIGKVEAGPEREDWPAECRTCLRMCMRSSS